MHLPGGSGLDVLRKLDAQRYPAPILVISGRGDIPTAIEAIRSGAFDFNQDMQSTERFRILNPPGDDPGAVVACEIERHLRPYMDEEEWEIQQSIPVVSEALELALPPGRHAAESWDHFAAVKPTTTSEGHLRWEIKDMPALDLENIQDHPVWYALAARMSVKWGGWAVEGTQSQWRQIGLWQDQLEEHRPDPTPEITARAQQLTAGASDLYTKLSRITGYIQKNIRYFIVMKGIGGWQAHDAGDIYRNGYGDCKDKATLLISMLEAVGIRAHYLVVDSERGVVDPAAPSLAANHMIVAIELPEGENDPRLMARVKAVDGKTLLIFDPTDEETLVGLIRGALQGAWGMLADGNESQVLQMPLMPPESAGLSRAGSFVLAADGSLSGDLAEIFAGDDAASERWFIKDHDANEIREQIESGLGSELPGLALKGYEFHQGESVLSGSLASGGGTHAGATDGGLTNASLDKPVRLDLHFSVSSYAHPSGPLLLLRPRVTGSHVIGVDDVMEGKPRLYAIELGHPGRWRDSFDIALPAGYIVDDAPEAVNIDVGFASYKSSVSSRGNLLHYERDYTVRQAEIPAAQAADFRKLEQAIFSDEKGVAVLKKQ